MKRSDFIKKSIPLGTVPLYLSGMPISVMAESSSLSALTNAGSISDRCLVLVFLDGGNGSEIAKLGGDMSPAFAALATITSPDIVVKVHENFINVGCDIITANTFATSRHVLDLSLIHI